jgi:uncharacterized protein
MPEKFWTRRRFLLASSALAAAGALDTLLVEPRNLVAERITIQLNRLPEVFSGFRIAQISDIHFGPYMSKSGVEHAVELARTFQPDLLVLTGDFVSHPLGKPNGKEGAAFAEPCADALKTLANVPMVAVLGNHDHWNDPMIVESAFRERGIKVLRNAAFPLERGQDRVWIAGADDVLARAVDMPQTLRNVPSSEATILLVHEPDYADVASRFPIDLQLSGHSHGGQVRIPGLGPPILPIMGEKYSVGLNRVGHLQVYTNRGLGVINPPVRFWCPPEVTFVTLVPPSAV